MDVGAEPIDTKRQKLFALFGTYWAFFFLVLEIVFFGVLARGFFSLRVIQNILFFGTPIFLLGTAETMVIITGGIDLSVGFVMGFATVLGAKLVAAFVGLGMGPAASISLGLGITLVIGLVPGFINGTLVARLNVPPFIATFAMFGISHGVSELLLGGVWAKNLPHLANAIGNGFFLYVVPGKILSVFQRPVVQRGQTVLEIVPNVVVITFVVILIVAFILKRTKFGQHTYAIGGNIDASVKAGINVRKHLVRIYMLSSFLATLAGTIYVLKYVTGKGDAGAPFLLDSIVAVELGGASLYGGRGTVGRTVLGCFILATLETGLRVLGVSTFDKYIAVGVILIVAVLIDQFSPELVHKED
jgi:ribose/xylose/arabinose/galactoside ABC-type transport system permease subunit